MSTLPSIARAAAAAALTMFVAACSSTGEEERSAASESALVTICGDGYFRDCSDYGPNGRVLCTCLPYTIDQVTAAPTAPAGTDACGADDVAIPTFLHGVGCTLGTVIDGQPVWACPTSRVPSTLPNALGLTTDPTQGPCYASDGSQLTLDPAAPPCEIVVETPSLTSNSCVGPIDTVADWTFVIDGLAVVRENPPITYCHYPLIGWAPCRTPQPGSCSGGCPAPVKLEGP